MAGGFNWSAKRRRFVSAYVSLEGDVQAAAREAGYSDVTDAQELLERPEIQEAILEASDKHVEVAGESEFTILQRLVNIAKGNIYDYFEVGPSGLPTLRHVEDLTLAEKLRVKKLQIKQTRYGYEEIIELHDPMAANEKLAKYLGLDKDGEALSPEEFAARAMAAAKAMQAADALDPADDKRAPF